MEIDVRSFVEIAGYPSEQEREAALALGAFFEVAVREMSIDEARQKLELAREAYTWFREQWEVADIKRWFSFGGATSDDEFWADEERRYRMVLWVAEQTVRIIEAGDFKFPEYLHLDRKQTGSYYTPKALIGALLDSALHPAVERAFIPIRPK
jgi:hypothetical protein